VFSFIIMLSEAENCSVFFTSGKQRRSSLFSPANSPRASGKKASDWSQKGLREKGSFVHNSSGSGRSLDDILMPGGKPIGVKGTGPRASAKLREVPGGQAEAERLFQELTQGGKDVTPAVYPGTLIELPNGRGTIGYRPASKSGPPTIDVKVVDAAGQRIPIRKIKFR
jgi:hypothetical protein